MQDLPAALEAQTTLTVEQLAGWFWDNDQPTHAQVVRVRDSVHRLRARGYVTLDWGPVIRVSEPTLRPCHVTITESGRKAA